MGSVKLKNIPSGYQTIITNGKHTIVGDEPLQSKGTDLGLAPTELMLSGLGMCKVATVRFIARKKGYKVTDVHSELSHRTKKAEDGTLTTKVKVNMKIEGDITDEQRAELIHEANNCYVHRMIQGEWDIQDAGDLEELI